MTFHLTYFCEFWENHFKLTVTPAELHQMVKRNSSACLLTWTKANQSNAACQQRFYCIDRQHTDSDDLKTFQRRPVDLYSWWQNLDYMLQTAETLDNRSNYRALIPRPASRPGRESWCATIWRQAGIQFWMKQWFADSQVLAAMLRRVIRDSIDENQTAWEDYKSLRWWGIN